MPAGRVRRARAGRADARAAGPDGADRGGRPPTPSPFARRCCSATSPQFLYEGDSPLAERRAAALTARPDAAGRAARARRRAGAARPARPGRAGRHRGRAAAARRGPAGPQRRRDRRPAAHSRAAVRRADGRAREAATAAVAAASWLDDLAGRAGCRVRVAGEERWAAVEDAGRLRDALGVPLPPGLRRRSWSRCRTRSGPGGPVRPHPCAVRRRTWPTGPASASRSSPTPCAAEAGVVIGILQ